MGALLTLDPPLGRGLDLASLRSRDLLLVGAGDGVAILRSVLLSAVRGDDRPRGVTAILSAQQRDDLPFFEEFRALHVDGSADLRFALEDAPPDWDGAVGPLPVLFRGYKLDPPATTAVIAGPGALHKFAVLELLMRGVADTAIHIVPERGFGCELDPCAACAGGGRYVCERGPAFLWSEVKTAPAPYF